MHPIYAAMLFTAFYSLYMTHGVRGLLESTKWISDNKNVNLWNSQRWGSASQKNLSVKIKVVSGKSQSVFFFFFDDWQIGNTVHEETLLQIRAWVNRALWHCPRPLTNLFHVKTEAPWKVPRFPSQTLGWHNATKTDAILQRNNYSRSRLLRKTKCWFACAHLGLRQTSSLFEETLLTIPPYIIKGQNCVTRTPSVCVLSFSKRRSDLLWAPRLKEEDLGRHIRLGHRYFHTGESSIMASKQSKLYTNNGIRTYSGMRKGQLDLCLQ